MELLVGCGHRRDKFIASKGNEGWKELITLDHNPDCKPDVVHDLNVLPYPFEDNKFDEIHAYEVLEHCGRQGDSKFFFGQFDEFWRILKPDGILCATVPSLNSRWIWGDPSHTRVIQQEQLWFLDRNFYSQLGTNPSSDFRSYYRGNFRIEHSEERSDHFIFVLNAVKDGH